MILRKEQNDEKICHLPPPPPHTHTQSLLLAYIQLFRVHHYIKNILVFVPLFFSLGFLNAKNICTSIIGFVIFSLASSIIYVFNDIRDIEKDRLHSTKCFRPLASGRISINRAVAAIVILSVILSLFLFLLNRKYLQNMLFTAGIVLLYIILNVVYSFGLKDIPIVDISILASGFLLRVLFGASIIGIEISVWLYLTIMLGAFYLGFGKRRNEINKNEKGTRNVMRFYDRDFLDKNMYMCQALCIVFCALWSIDVVTIQRFNTNAFVYTIPLLLVILFKYNLNLESDSDGDPTSIILHDKIILVLCLIYILIAFCIVYFNRKIQ
jgi:4-hydroxybenzoate polyprenyltransferase